jgi:hypothetical protein
MKISVHGIRKSDFGNRGVYGRIILKLILEKYGVMWTELF